MAKNKIKFNKYNSKSNYDRAKNNGEVDNATFSVVRTPDCNANENNNNTGDVKDLYINDTKLTDVYNSRKANGSRTSVSVGGLPAGTDVSTLTSMSLGEVLDKILFKTTTPTIKTNPSMSISYKTIDYSVGTIFPEITESNISVNGGMYQLEIDGSYVNRGVVSNGFDTIEEIVYTPSDRVTVAGTNKIAVKVRIKSGPTPTDSDEKPYTSTTPQIPYQGGVLNKIVTIYPHYDWFATGVAIESETAPQIDITSKYPLSKLKIIRSLGISKIDDIMLDIGGGDIQDKQTIKVPGKISNCKTFVSGTWKDYAFDELYTYTIEQINGKNYYIYTMKDEAYVGGAVGGSRLKFTVNP
jgi:hypothetical protein